VRDCRPPAFRAQKFSWSSQHLLATARGDYTNDQMKAVIDTCLDLGAALYDPQTGDRIDSA
jgi:hypothetical protein